MDGGDKLKSASVQVLSHSDIEQPETRMKLVKPQMVEAVASNDDARMR